MPTRKPLIPPISPRAMSLAAKGMAKEIREMQRLVDFLNGRR